MWGAPCTQSFESDSKQEVNLLCLWATPSNVETGIGFTPLDLDAEDCSPPANPVAQPLSVSFANAIAPSNEQPTTTNVTDDTADNKDIPEDYSNFDTCPIPLLEPRQRENISNVTAPIGAGESKNFQVSERV